jgi:hypothetical protein
MTSPLPPKPKSPRTWGEIMALPERERKEALRASVERVFGRMEAGGERYLDGDYQRTGSYKNTRWGR